MTTRKPRPLPGPHGYQLTDVIGTDLLPVSRPTVSGYIAKGILKVSKIGRGYYVTEESLLDLPNRLAVN